jgi:hypothetical protein
MWQSNNPRIEKKHIFFIIRGKERGEVLLVSVFVMCLIISQRGVLGMLKHFPSELANPGGTGSPLLGSVGHPFASASSNAGITASPPINITAVASSRIAIVVEVLFIIFYLLSMVQG